MGQGPSQELPVGQRGASGARPFTAGDGQLPGGVTAESMLDILQLVQLIDMIPPPVKVGSATSFVTEAGSTNCSLKLQIFDVTRSFCPVHESHESIENQREHELVTGVPKEDLDKFSDAAELKFKVHSELHGFFAQGGLKNLNSTHSEGKEFTGHFPKAKALLELQNANVTAKDDMLEELTSTTTQTM